MQFREGPRRGRRGTGSAPWEGNEPSTLFRRNLMRNHRAQPLVILATFALVACTDGAGPRGAGKVSLALSTVQPSTLSSAPTGQALSASLQAGGHEPLTDASNNTIAITSAELVLRKVELKPGERSGCKESG